MRTIDKQINRIVTAAVVILKKKRACHSKRKRALDERKNSAERRFTIIAFFRGVIRHEETAFGRASARFVYIVNERSVCIPFPRASRAHLLPQRPSKFFGGSPPRFYLLRLSEKKRKREIV